MMKEAKWNIGEPAPADKVNRLATEVGIDRVLAELLVKRGSRPSSRPAHSSVPAWTISTTRSS